MGKAGNGREQPEAAVRQEVGRRLDALEREEGVRVIYACESGSRAWGFASTDSDYDVRFLYVRPRDWYLSIAASRDVIEQPIVDPYDVNGWDLRKALQLFRKSNPPLLEWLGSPIVYRERTSAAAALRRLAARRSSPRACAFHYLHMAKGNYRDYLQDDSVRLKKYLYVLRPLLAVRWIERGRGVVPTEFGRLVDETVESAELKRAIEALLERKRRGIESERGARIEALSAFIEVELARLESGFAAKAVAPPAVEEMDALFRRTLQEAWSGAAEDDAKKIGRAAEI